MVRNEKPAAGSTSAAGFWNRFALSLAYFREHDRQPATVVVVMPGMMGMMRVAKHCPRLIPERGYECQMLWSRAGWGIRLYIPAASASHTKFGLLLLDTFGLHDLDCFRTRVIFRYLPVPVHVGRSWSIEN